MKIRVEHDSAAENEVVLRCPFLDEEMLEVLSLLKARAQKLCVWQEEKELLFLAPAQVLYGESVEEKTFLYGETEVYRTALSLTELEARCEGVGFCRVGKSLVVNLNRIASLKSCAAGRIEAKMQNGERLIVSRHYAPLLRERLGL